MHTKIVRILTILSLSAFFNISCMVPEVSVNQKLINAAANGNLEGVQDALKEGADINYNGEFAESSNMSSLGSAVFQAASKDYFSVVKFLIESGASTKTKLYSGGKETSLFESAIMWGRLQIAEYLIEEKLNEKTYYYKNIENLDIIKFLIWHGITHRKKEDHKDIIHVIKNLESKLRSMRAVPENEFTEDEIKETRSHCAQEEEIIKVLKKFALKADGLKNKSFKDMVKKVNQVKRAGVQAAIKEKNILPNVLSDIVDNYSLYPENIEEFFKISDEDLEELIKVYSEEFCCYKEKDFGQDACSIM